MYLADCHLHSCVSPDAQTSMAELGEAALAAGMDEICFTDHVQPFSIFRPEPDFDYDWDALLEEFGRARAALEGRIELGLGVELGDVCLDVPRTEAMLEDMPPLDFVIGSIHTLSERMGRVNLYRFDPPDEAGAREGILDYLEQARKMAAWGNFSVMGHLTLPLRYLNENRGFQLTFDGYEAEVAEVLRTLIGNGCGIELNTNRGRTPLPDGKWLRMYRELGGEIITIGSDAHGPELVGCAVREGQKLLRECGFTRFCTFRRREPVWHTL